MNITNLYTLVIVARNMEAIRKRKENTSALSVKEKSNKYIQIKKEDKNGKRKNQKVC